MKNKLTVPQKVKHRAVYYYMMSLIFAVHLSSPLRKAGAVTERARKGDLIPRAAIYYEEQNPYLL